jgi:hypothetical protein
MCQLAPEPRRRGRDSAQAPIHGEGSRIQHLYGGRRPVHFELAGFYRRDIAEIALFAARLMAAQLG